MGHSANHLNRDVLATGANTSHEMWKVSPIDFNVGGGGGGQWTSSLLYCMLRFQWDSLHENGSW